MRGKDARSQTVAKSSASTFTRNQKNGMSHVLTGFVADRNPSDGPDGPPRNKVTATADPGIAEDAVSVEIELTSGERIHQRVDHAIGNLGRPMTDRELEEKFFDQAALVLPSGQARDLIALCWKTGELSDMRQLIEAAVPRA